MTLTIVARDAKTGMLGVAQSTNPIAVGSRCPFVRANVGAVSTQAYTDPSLGPLAIRLLELGYPPQKVLAELEQSDPNFAYRQIGIVDRAGRAAAISGSQCKTHTLALTGPNYVVMGNLLATDRVVPQMERAWLESEGRLFEDRLLAAVVAGRDEGGDAGGHRSACLLVHANDPYPRSDLRVDYVPKRAGERDAVDALAELLDRWRPLIPFYEQRPQRPDMTGWMDWLKERGTPFED